MCNVSRLNCPRSEFVRNVNVEKVNINSCRFVSTKLKKTHVFSFQSNNTSLRTPPYWPNFIVPLLRYWILWDECVPLVSVLRRLAGVDPPSPLKGWGVGEGCGFKQAKEVGLKFCCLCAFLVVNAMVATWTSSYEHVYGHGVNMKILPSVYLEVLEEENLWDWLGNYNAGGIWCLITTSSSRTEENKPILRDISFEKRGIMDSGKSGFVDSLFKPWKLYSISDMSLFTLKVEMQTDQLEHLREKVRTAQDETRSVQAKNELLERFVDQEP